MYLTGEEVYKKFSDYDVQIKIPKKLLLNLMKQVSRHNDILNDEKDIINNFAVSENINNTEMILVKLFILIAEPYDRKEVMLSVNMAEFLVLRDIVFCNYTMKHLKTKINFNLLKMYKQFYEQMENIYQKLDRNEVHKYWDFLKS
ncbi:hypothetical protein EV204_101306 [Tissierella praeacuta]|uniref:hypothetical protein n=1 Tax=Tissierella praeacuta TaxID=43131 RepID=UPI0010E76612|nr:hypothetical protein [Tissierella praeacuta]TCU79327.1 hypothetical protein EV204_101306 [Tissierella praeacuta]